MTEDRDRCLAAGMNDYLSQPIKPDPLAAALIPPGRAEACLDTPRLMCHLVSHEIHHHPPAP